ncbi:MAG: T9SS type A sorting domain-containing protein [Chitinophagales bacterium]|nr:T9SS type A sorting domain-containing protein [Chitinophagales bacterium]
MKYIYSLLSIFFLFVIGLSTIQAQESISTTGGDVFGNDGSVAYTIGQVVYTTNTSTTGNVSQGVQQAYEVYVMRINNIKSNIAITVFPNPVTENLTLQINDYKNEKLFYWVNDMQEKILNKNRITTYQTQINTTNLPSATYIINVVNQENKIIKSFKIIKK